MRRNVGVSLALFVGMAVSTGAWADFIVKGADKPAASKGEAAPSALAACPAGLTERGTRPVLRPLLTAGGEMSGLAALKKVVPSNEPWTLRGDFNAAQQTVTWRGGEPWPDIAGEIALAAHVCVTVDWQRREVVIAPSRTPAALVAETVSPSSPVASDPSLPPKVAGAQGTTPTTTPKTTPKEAAPVAALYALVKGETVRQTFQRWCKASGWTLVWSADMDYPVGVSLTFPPDTDLRGAVREVLRAYWHEQYAMEGRAYQNQVLEIVRRTR